MILAVTIGSSGDDFREQLAAEVPELLAGAVELPPLPPLVIAELWQLMDLVRTHLLERESGWAVDTWSEAQVSMGRFLADPRLVQQTWDDVVGERDPLRGLAFIALHLWSDSELLRAVAVAAVTRVVTGAQFLVGAARELVQSDEEIVRDLAGVALRNLGVGPAESVSAFVGDHPRSPAAGPRSVLLNGTYSGYPSRDDWFWPTGEFAEHVRARVASDLYDDEQSFFRWGGGYSGPARRAAARQLDAWVGVRGLDGIHLALAHSHGGNVAFDYLEQGGRIEVLVLMHTPLIRRPARAWEEISGRIRRVLVMSAKLDWVVWLDRAGSLPQGRLPLMASLESVLGAQAVTLSNQIGRAWFSHSHFTKRSTWVAHDIAGLVSYHHGEVHVER